MKKAISCGIFLLASPAALGIDFSVQPRLEVGIMDYTYERNPIVVTSSISGMTQDGLFSFDRVNSFALDSLKLNDNLPYISGGATIFADRFFLDLSALRTDKGKDSTEQAQVLESTTHFSPLIPNGFHATQIQRESVLLQNDARFDRSEYSLSLGYAVSENFVVFAGYRRSKADFDIRRSGDYRLDFLDTSDFTNLTATGIYSDRHEFDFEQKGPFVGGAYAWSIDHGALSGILSTNLALAFLDAKIRGQVSGSSVTDVIFTNNNTGQSFPFEGLEFDGMSEDFKGDALGLSFGVGWRGLTPVEGLTYSLGINGYSYRFRGDTNLSGVTTETVLRYQAGISYTF